MAKDKADSDFDEMARQIDEDLSVIRRAMRTRLHETYDSGGMTAPQRLAMQTLARHGPMPVTQIAEAMSLSHSTVSGIL